MLKFGGLENTLDFGLLLKLFPLRTFYDLGIVFIAVGGWNLAALMLG